MNFNLSLTYYSFFSLDVKLIRPVRVACTLCTPCTQHLRFFFLKRSSTYLSFFKRKNFLGFQATQTDLTFISFFECKMFGDFRQCQQIS